MVALIWKFTHFSPTLFGAIRKNNQNKERLYDDKPPQIPAIFLPSNLALDSWLEKWRKFLN